MVTSTMGAILVRDCQFGISPVNYSDSDSDLQRKATHYLNCNQEILQHQPCVELIIGLALQNLKGKEHMIFSAFATPTKNTSHG